MNKKSIIILAGLLTVVLLSPGYAVTTHTMGSGDTLWELSAQHYGDPTLYPILLEVNGIDNPRTIPNGRVIIIPDKATMENIARETDPARKNELISQATSGSVIPPGEDQDQGNPTPPPSQPGADSEARTGRVNPNDTTFTNILRGPQVTPDKLIKLEDHD